MTYYYDLYGWLTDEVLPGRSTEITPPAEIPAGQAANWTGFAWRVIPYVPPPSPVVDLGPPYGIIPRAALLGWAAATGMRAIIEDVATAIGHPLRSIALVLRDVLVGGADSLDFAEEMRDSNLAALNAWSNETVPEEQRLTPEARASLLALIRPERLTRSRRPDR